MTAISYNTPLNSGSPSGTTDSIFPGVLGSSTTGGYVGDLYTTIGTVLASVTAISTAAAGFVSEVSNFQGAVGTLLTTVQSFKTYMSELDVSLYSTLKLIDEYSAQVNTGVRVLYGLTIVMASTMLLGALMVAFCDKVGCRYLIYASCVMLFFIGVLGFLLSVFFSVIVPALYFGCQFMDHSLASAANFDGIFCLTQPTSAASSLTRPSEAMSPPACLPRVGIW